MLTHDQILELITTQGDIAAYATNTKAYGFVPMVVKSSTEKVVASVVFQTITAGDKTHTAGIAHLGDHGFTYFCGDPALCGVLNEVAMEFDAAGAVAMATPEVKELAIKEMMSSYGVAPQNDGCTNPMYMTNLLSKMRAGESITSISATVACPHVKHFFGLLEDPEAELKKLKKIRKDLLAGKKAVVPDSPIAFTLESFGFQGEAVLVTGPGGDGKTHAINEFAEANGLEMVSVQGHGQIEAIDMYGYVSVDDEGNKGWLDGPVSQAARKASKGIKTLLFIDEFLNIPMREAAGLKAAFEPYKGHYFFKTGRNVRGEDGLLVQETLKVPVENLQIVAAANIGDGYASEEIDKALKQRFMILNYEAPEAKIKAVLEGICREKGFSLGLVSKLLSFRDAIRNAKEAGEPIGAASLRHLSRKFLGLMKEEHELEEIAKAQMLQFVGFDYEGRPIEEQVELYEEIVEKTLAA